MSNIVLNALLDINRLIGHVLPAQLIVVAVEMNNAIIAQIQDTL